MVMCIISAVGSCVQILKGIGNTVDADIVYDESCNSYSYKPDRDACNAVNVSWSFLLGHQNNLTRIVNTTENIVACELSSMFFSCKNHKCNVFYVVNIRDDWLLRASSKNQPPHEYAFRWHKRYPACARHQHAPALFCKNKTKTKTECFKIKSNTPRTQ